MPAHPLPFRRRDGWLRRLALVLPVVAILGGAAAATATTGDPPDGARVNAAAARPGTSYALTLLTGDVVALHVAGDGQQAASVLDPAGHGTPGRAPTIFEEDGQVHLIPAEAVPYVRSGVLDERLFDLTYLVNQGYDDRSQSDLPLLVAAPDGSSASSLPAIPPGAQEVRRLTSIGAVSVTVEKSRVRDAWLALRGSDAAPLHAEDVRLAGAGRVWLNGTVRPTLDGSVPRVGAPAAWDAGFDGTEVRVAVLDTGYDPNHPDLAGQVALAEDFTKDPDPQGQTATDGNGHGTHVAATIAGTGAASNGTYTGVAPGADLLIGKVLSNHGFGYDDWIIAGMEWAVANDAKVVSMSLGTDWASDGSDPLSQAVDRLTESSGTLFVVAAGNGGPGESTVTAPGTATQALTVGATTKDDKAARFSSRGPRIGDEAIKPEIVAPGVDIVAARAAGTSIGNGVGAQYASVSGTSMATPHVAGAAAILAQQHPEWDADEIKARLISTSVSLADQPVTFRGAGRLDVAAAVTGPAVAVSDGALSLGRNGQDADEITRRLTYHNPSDAEVTLQLSAEVTSAADPSRAPALRLSPSVLTVPAGGQASADVTLVPGETEPGRYAGYLVASDGSSQLRTVLAVTVDGPLRTVTVNAMDRNGAPASGPVQLWNAGTGEMIYGFLFDGVAQLQVQAGLYSLFAVLETQENFMPISFTIAGDPELSIQDDLNLSFDARDGEPVRVTTPRETDLRRFDVGWHRKVGDHSVSAVPAVSNPRGQLYAIASEPAETGTFEVTTYWQAAQPLLTVQFDDADGTRQRLLPWLASIGNAYPRQASLPVVDVGAGTPEEFAAVDVRGKVALASRLDQGGNLPAQMEAAHAAGAAMLLVANTVPGSLYEELTGPLPTYLLEEVEGALLRQAIAERPDLTLDLVGVPDSTYTYHLAFTEAGAVPGGRTYDAANHPTAVVQTDFREDSERMNGAHQWIPVPDSGALANGLGMHRNAPVVRTDYLSTEGLTWQQLGHPHGDLGYYWTSPTADHYRAGETYRQQLWGPLTHPGVPEIRGLEEFGLPAARFHDTIRIMMYPYLFDNGRFYGTTDKCEDYTLQMNLSRNGKPVGTSPMLYYFPQAQFTVPADEAWYDLGLQVINNSDPASAGNPRDRGSCRPGGVDSNWMDTSIRTDSTWRFRSARSDERRVVLPLVQLNYHLDSGPHNDVPAGAPSELRIDPGYQPGAAGPGGFTVTVQVSYDGNGWLTAPVEQVDGMVRATIPAAPSHAEFATVRVVATDSDGNRLTQLIERAWRID